MSVIYAASAYLLVGMAWALVLALTYRNHKCAVDADEVGLHTLLWPITLAAYGCRWSR